MNKISCNVCIDLMPLVKDGVASEDSHLLVDEHIKTCDNCRNLYDNLNTEIPVMNEENVVSKIKRQLFIIAIGIVVIGAMLGVALSDSAGMFYNILIMPIIGVIGYFALNKKAYLTPISLFMFSYIWLFIKYIYQGILGQGFTIYIFIIPIYLSIIYAGLCTIGIVIGFLLKFSFGKEVIK